MNIENENTETNEKTLAKQTFLIARVELTETLQNREVSTLPLVTMG